MLFFSNVMHDVPRDVFHVGTISQKFDVVVCMQTVGDFRVPIIHITLQLFWSTVSKFIHPRL